MAERHRDAADRSPQGSETGPAGQPERLPDVRRPRGAAWRRLEGEGVAWDGQIILMGAEADLAARLIITHRRAAIVRGGQIVLEVERTFLRPAPLILPDGTVGLAITYDGVPTEDLFLQIRDGRHAAGELVRLLGGNPRPVVLPPDPAAVADDPPPARSRDREQPIASVHPEPHVPRHRPLTRTDADLGNREEPLVARRDRTERLPAAAEDTARRDRLDRFDWSIPATRSERPTPPAVQTGAADRAPWSPATAPDSDVLFRRDRPGGAASSPATLGSGATRPAATRMLPGEMVPPPPIPPAEVATNTVRVLPAPASPQGVGRDFDWNLRPMRGVAPRSARRRRRLDWVARLLGIFLLLALTAATIAFQAPDRLPGRDRDDERLAGRSFDAERTVGPTVTDPLPGRTAAAPTPTQPIPPTQPAREIAAGTSVVDTAGAQTAIATGVGGQTGPLPSDLPAIPPSTVPPPTLSPTATATLTPTTPASLADSLAGAAASETAPAEEPVAAEEEPTAMTAPLATRTPAPTATATATATLAPTATSSATLAPTATATTVPATATTAPTATATATTAPTATTTATATTVPSTETPVPTQTAAPTATATTAPTATAVPTATATATATVPPTATVTPEPTATATPALLGPPLPPGFAAAAASVTATTAPAQTPESTSTPPPTNTPDLPPTLTPEPATATIPATATSEPTTIATATTAPTTTATATPTASPTAMMGPTATATAALTATAVVTIPAQAATLVLGEDPAQVAPVGPFRYGVETAIRAGAGGIPALGLAPSPLGQWVAVVVSAYNWSDAPATLRMQDFTLDLDDGADEALLDSGTGVIAGRYGFDTPYAFTAQVPYAAGEDHRFLLLYLVPRTFEDIDLQIGAQQLDLNPVFDTAVPLSDLGSRPDEPRLLEAEVTRVLDAFTIEVEVDGTRQQVRYLGIDAPTGDDCYATAARSANVALVGGETVWLERQRSNADRQGRLLRDVWVENASGDLVLVGEQLVADGAAEASTTRPNIRLRGWLDAAQAVAQRAGNGLWTACDDAGEEDSAWGAAPAIASVLPFLFGLLWVSARPRLHLPASRPGSTRRERQPVHLDPRD